ncbi:hypothetical protein HYU16_02650 [Candidatus Woesearchaeota archaeon]|nr:hypothetical protein [Candidatus Woesearchaeota archaeon]
MAVLDQKIIMWIVAAAAAYVAYRLLFSSKDASLTSYDRQVDEILTSEKYKVKGRFEE